MSLINCPACQRQVSKAAIACPQCGHPINPSAAQPNHTKDVVKGVGIVAALIALVKSSQWIAKIIALIVLLIFALLFFWINK